MPRGFRTGVRFPSGPPKQKALLVSAFCFGEFAKKGESNAVTKQSSELFWNGDRSVLQTIKRNIFFLVCKTQERFPSGPPKNAIAAAMAFFYPSPKGLAWHHALACMESRLCRAWHQPLGLYFPFGLDAIPSSTDSMRDFVAIPYRNKLRIPCTAPP